MNCVQVVELGSLARSLANACGETTSHGVVVAESLKQLDEFFCGIGQSKRSGEEGVHPPAHGIGELSRRIDVNGKCAIRHGREIDKLAERLDEQGAAIDKAFVKFAELAERFDSQGIDTAPHAPPPACEHPQGAWLTLPQTPDNHEFTHCTLCGCHRWAKGKWIVPELRFVPKPACEHSRRQPFVAHGPRGPIVRCPECDGLLYLCVWYIPEPPRETAEGAGKEKDTAQ